MVAERGTNVSDIEDKEPGEVIESGPPLLKVGEEREINSTRTRTRTRLRLKKKLLKCGLGWESPDFGDELTVHYVGTLLDGTKFDSTRDRDEPFNFKLGRGEVVAGLDHGIITMKKGETALFTLPPELGYGATCTNCVPPNSSTHYEVELISWIRVVDVCKDGGVVKRIMEKGGEHPGQPGGLDEVLVKYQVMLDDGTVVAKSPDEGVVFYVKDGLPKAIKTMRRGEKVNLIVQPKYAFGEGGRDGNKQFPLIPPSSVLRIDLELVSFNPVINVTGDSKVLKKILREGEGDLTANEGATVTIRYMAMLENGIVLEKNGLPLKFIIDEEQVIAGLDRAAATMKKGELAILTISPEYGFGSVEVKRDLAVVPPCSTLVYEVQMLDFTKEKPPSEMSSNEKIKAAWRKKEEGNTLLKSRKYQRAAKKYDKAADYFTDSETFGDDDLKLVEALRVSCWLNSAACSFKLKDFQGAIRLCSKVLLLDKEFYNVKALYRRAQAYMATADLQSAELDIKKALEADPQNRGVKFIQNILKQIQAESNKRDAKPYTKDSSVAAKRLKVEKVENNGRAEEVMAMEKVQKEKVAVSSEPPDNDTVVDSLGS